MEKITIISTYDSQKIYANLYNVENPKGIVQILHGMKEHQLRYKALAEALNKEQYIVITSDMRGHGENAPFLGYMEGKKTWEALIQDQVSISKYITKQYPGLKLHLMGHSMGSILARNVIQKNADLYEKLILIGTPPYQVGAKFGILLTKILCIFHSNEYVSSLVEKIVLDPFNKGLKNPKTSSDWISYNEKNVEEYIKDPYCDSPWTLSSYKALFHLLNNQHKKRLFKVSNPELPILFLAGVDDPCTLGEKGLKTSINDLSKVGYKNITKKLYENMRHEVLNEVNREIVYKDIINFLN